MACSGCSSTFENFIKLCNDAGCLSDYLKKHHCVPEGVLCQKCGKPCTFNGAKSLFRCNRINKKSKRRCAFSVSALKNTFFGKAHLQLAVICKIVLYLLTWKPPRQKFITTELNITAKTFVDWSSFYREVLLHHRAMNCSKTGWPGKIVEVDEAKFGRRKFNRGRLVEGVWVFGGVERGDKTKQFMVPVVRRDADTLLQVLKDHVLPGTTIHSDGWKAYKNLKDEGFQHFTVNHSQNFVDPITGTHTQNIERLWRDVRHEIALLYLLFYCCTKPSFFKSTNTPRIPKSLESGNEFAVTLLCAYNRKYFRYQPDRSLT